MKFKLKWKGGDEETVEGDTIAIAFTMAGYGAGALGALESYEVIRKEEDDNRGDSQPGSQS